MECGVLKGIVFLRDWNELTNHFLNYQTVWYFRG